MACIIKILVRVALNLRFKAVKTDPVNHTMPPAQFQGAVRSDFPTHSDFPDFDNVSVFSLLCK